MKYEDWKYFAWICTVLGVLLLIGGGIAYSYEETVYWLGYPIGTTYPYRDYSVPLFIFGVVLFIIGVASFGRAQEERKLEIPKPVTRFCPQCGKALSPDVKFCPHCGKELG